MKTITNQILKCRLISECSSPWLSPAILVKKKSGAYRLCVDYRKLSEITIRDEYTLPLIYSVLYELSGSTIFSTLDLHSGYWQVALDEAAKPKTAFCPGQGLPTYHFNAY
ncbi:Transposon Ty3-I Gag-Pol polyprotein [Thelohanellus kitauei]|uniref:Transposon Ty3-I Gag-Pol polyprotein n=1 Tax=Thelohanellus kitauei TaxID=669202 RepID=A0A0C2IJS3_THEKT|nr:Transposon Ty3-I Gag-Pol polyprotein [Thelohanellus kitauei]